MGRLSRAFKKLSPILKIVAPVMFPAITPLLALARSRAQPPMAPEEVAWQTPQGGYLPPEAMNNFSWRGAARGGMAGAGTGAVLGPWGAVAGAVGGAAAGGYEEGDLDFDDESTGEDYYEEYNDEEYFDEEY